MLKIYFEALVKIALLFNKRFPRFGVINIVKVFFIECILNVVILKSFVRIIVSWKPVIEEKNPLVPVKSITLTV